MLSTTSVFKGVTKEEQIINMKVDQLVQDITYRKHKNKRLTPRQTAESMFNLFE